MILEGTVLTEELLTAGKKLGVKHLRKQQITKRLKSEGNRRRAATDWFAWRTGTLVGVVVIGIKVMIQSLYFELILGVFVLVRVLYSFFCF